MLKKQTNLRGEVKLTLKYSRRRGKTDKYWWRRYRNRQILVETLKKQTNIGGDFKETDKYWWRR